MSETIPVYFKSKDEVLQAEPAPVNQAVQADQDAAAPPYSLTEKRCQGERENRQGDAGARSLTAKANA